MPDETDLASGFKSYDCDPDAQRAFFISMAIATNTENEWVAYTGRFKVQSDGSVVVDQQSLVRDK